MDSSDYWTSRLASAKRHFIHQQNTATRLTDRLNMDDYVDVEEEVRSDYFPCPYCYDEYNISSLCSHLKDEHSCDSRPTVCPVCSVKVESDMLSHITMRHGHLFKFQRRRRFRRVAVPDSQTLSLLGRDLREAHLQVLLGGGAYRSSSTTPSAAATDPLLSSFIINNPASEAEEFSKAVTSCAEDSSMENTTSQNLWKSSFDPSLGVEERQKQMRQAARKTVFMQDLVVSALLVE